MFIKVKETYGNCGESDIMININNINSFRTVWNNPRTKMSRRLEIEYNDKSTLFIQGEKKIIEVLKKLNKRII